MEAAYERADTNLAGTFSAGTGQYIPIIVLNENRSVIRTGTIVQNSRQKLHNLPRNALETPHYISKDAYTVSLQHGTNCGAFPMRYSLTRKIRSDIRTKRVLVRGSPRMIRTRNFERTILPAQGTKFKF